MNKKITYVLVPLFVYAEMFPELDIFFNKLPTTNKSRTKLVCGLISFVLLQAYFYYDYSSIRLPIYVHGLPW